jgi:uncharacterized protein YndB with AHSA1/START domain
MTQGKFKVTVDAPVEIVWPWVARLEKHVDWSPKAYRVEWLSGEPNQVGSRYRSVGWIPGKKDNVNEGEITERVENQRFALGADDKPGPFSNTYTLRSVDGGTEVAFEIVFPKMGFPVSTIAGMAFATVGSADIRKRMQLLKQNVDRSNR